MATNAVTIVSKKTKAREVAKPEIDLRATDFFS